MKFYQLVIVLAAVLMVAAMFGLIGAQVSCDSKAHALMNEGRRSPHSYYLEHRLSFYRCEAETYRGWIPIDSVNRLAPHHAERFIEKATRDRPHARVPREYVRHAFDCDLNAPTDYAPSDYVPADYAPADYGEYDPNPEYDAAADAD